MTTTVVWSAMAGEFPGAGVYLGLASCDEHVAVARGLGPRQARLFLGGRMKGASGGPSSIHYYAVRDPSAVRVIRIQPGTSGGSRHVELRILLGVNGQSEALRVFGPPPPGTPLAAFIMTIGLPPHEEVAFFEDVLVGCEQCSWQELLDRVTARRVNPPKRKPPKP